MNQWTYLFAVLLLIQSSVVKAEQNRITPSQLDTVFSSTLSCSARLVSVVKEIEQNKDRLTRTKKSTDIVNPADIAGATTLVVLLGARGGSHAGVIGLCTTAYDRLLEHKVMAYIPESWQRPGSTVDRGKSSLIGARTAGTVLQTVSRQRITEMNTVIDELRKHAINHLNSVNALYREAQKLDDGDRTPSVQDTVHKGGYYEVETIKYVDDLADCASKLATFANYMTDYRTRTFRDREPGFKVAPRKAVAKRNIEDIMKDGGHLQNCIAHIELERDEHHLWLRVKLDKLLPRSLYTQRRSLGFTPSLLTWTRVMQQSGDYLKGGTPQKLGSIDSWLDKFVAASRELLGQANTLKRDIRRSNTPEEQRRQDRIARDKEWRENGQFMNIRLSSHCLDVHAPDIRRNGGKVQVWECNSEPQQKWRLRDNRLENKGGLCLSANVREMRSNGGKVIVWACNGDPAQQWRHENGQLINGGGLCLHVPNSDMTKNGGKVQLWDCESERFRWLIRRYR